MFVRRKIDSLDEQMLHGRFEHDTIKWATDEFKDYARRQEEETLLSFDVFIAALQAAGADEDEDSLKNNQGFRRSAPGAPQVLLFYFCCDIFLFFL